MSTNWGLALDAELAYRHQQIRSDFRPWRRTARRAAETVAPVASSTLNADAQSGSLVPATQPGQAVSPTARQQQAAERQQVRAA